MLAKRILAATCTAALVGISLPTLTAAPALAAPMVSVKEGKSQTISGTVPRAWAGSTVYLETARKQDRTELASAVAGRDGRVSAKVHLGGDGEYEVQWRVVRNGKTRWTSQPFTLKVSDAGRKHVMLDSAGRVMNHVSADPAFSPSSKSVKPAKSPGKRTPRSADYVPKQVGSLSYLDSGAQNEADTAADTAADATEDAAEDASKSTSQMLGDFAKTFGENVGWDFVAGGVNLLFGMIFPGTAPATAEQVAQLTDDVEQGFATVENQLTTIQADLNTLNSTVSSIQNEVLQTNANAAAAACNSLLAEANGYVTDIENTYGNWQTVIDPTWISANLTGQNSLQALKIVGEEVYGAGAGTPSFAQGVISLQTDVNSLASLLNQNGASATNGLIATCSTAVSANVAAANSTTASATASSTSGTIVPLGSIEEQYYSQMHSIVSYYTGWMNLGQVLASQGGQMALASLQSSSIQSAQDVQDICANTTPAAGASALTCPGIAYNTQNAINANNSAWNSVGASWYDVSDGMLLGDARVDNTAAYIQPSQNAWVRDIATFGSVVPGLQGPTFLPGTTTYSQDITTNNLNATGGTVNYEPGYITFDPSTGSSSSAMSFIPSTEGTVTLSWPWGSESYTVGAGTYGGYYYDTTSSGVGQALPMGGSAFAPGGDGTFTLKVTWADGSVSTITQTVTSTTGPETTSYYNPSGPLSSLSASTNATPAAGVTSLASPQWLGVNFTGADTAAWSWAFPFANQTQAASVSSTSGQVMASSGLLNGGAAPTNLILYTGETSSFDINSSTSFGTAPSVADNSEFSPGSTFPDTTETAYSFIDTNAAPQPGYNFVIGAPSGSAGKINTAAYVMANQWATNGGGNQTCNIGGDGIGSCSGNFSYTNYMSVNDSSGSFNAGATNNQLFYAPLTQNNAYSMSMSVGYDKVSSSYSNETAQVTGTPSFMTSTPQSQYMWPVLNLPASGATAPCTMTTFQSGSNGSSGVGNVCQQWFTEWLAGAQSITTGPVAISAGTTQGTVLPSGNNAAGIVVDNASTSAQTVTIYAQITSGPAQLGSVINVGNSSGADANGASITNCSNINSDLQCTLTVQPGLTQLQLPLAGSYSSNSVLQLGLAAPGMASGSASTLLPVASGAQALPGAVTSLTANADTKKSGAVNLSWTVPAATPPVTGYQFTLVDPAGTQTTQSALIGSSATPAYTGTVTQTTCNGGGCNPITGTVNPNGTITLTSTVQDVESTQYLYNGSTMVYSSPSTATGASWTWTSPSPIPVGTSTWHTTSANWDTYFTVTVNQSSGQTSQDAQVFTSGTTATATLTMPTSQSGVWQFTVAAVNAAGTGPGTTINATLGNAAPIAPSNFTATETGQGTIALDWDPVTADPALSEYTLTITTPVPPGSPVPRPQVVSTTVSEYMIQDVTDVGTWQFSLVATNSIGDSPAVAASVTVTGMVPTQPQSLDVDVDADGWVSAWFSASDSVPSADSYYVALYEPGSQTPVATVTVPTYEHDEMVRVRNFYQIAKVDPVGTWKVVVTPSNSIGAGIAAQSSLYISASLISEVEGNLAREVILGEIPAFLTDYAQDACTAGTWHTGLNVFGSCSAGTFTPAAS